MRSCIMPGLPPHLVHELNVGIVYIKIWMSQVRGKFLPADLCRTKRSQLQLAFTIQVDDEGSCIMPRLPTPLVQELNVGTVHVYVKIGRVVGSKSLPAGLCRTERSQLRLPVPIQIADEGSLDHPTIGTYPATKWKHTHVACLKVLWEVEWPEGLCRTKRSQLLLPVPIQVADEASLAVQIAV